MKNIASREELEKLVAEKYVLIDFTAKWCGPCQSLKPILEWFGDEKEYEKLVIVSVDVDKFSKLSDEYHIQSMPTMVFMKEGKEEKRFVGLPAMEVLRKYVREFLGLKSLKSLTSMSTDIREILYEKQRRYLWGYN